MPILNDQLGSIVEAMGCELIGCELLPAGRKRLLRLYVDKVGGVSVEDCSSISRQVSALLDVEDPIQGEYILEVSSPGIDRPLFNLKKKKKCVGEVIKLKTRLPINGRRQFKGKLTQVVDGNLYIIVDGIEEALVIPFESVEKGNLVANINFK